MKPRHLLSIGQLAPEEVRNLLFRAGQLKSEYRDGKRNPSLAGKTLGLLFSKPSTRTRVSFCLLLVGRTLCLGTQGAFGNVLVVSCYEGHLWGSLEVAQVAREKDEVLQLISPTAHREAETAKAHRG